MHGFADRCLTTRPFHRGDTASHTTCAGADDETRTRDPHLGKVMRYQLRYIRIALRYAEACAASSLVAVRVETLSRHAIRHQIPRSTGIPDAEAMR